MDLIHAQLTRGSIREHRRMFSSSNPASALMWMKETRAIICNELIVCFKTMFQRIETAPCMPRKIFNSPFACLAGRHAHPGP